MKLFFSQFDEIKGISRSELVGEKWLSLGNKKAPEGAFFNNSHNWSLTVISAVRTLLAANIKRQLLTWLKVV